LHVRNVPDELYEALRTQARREHRSVNAEAITILQRALAGQPSTQDLLGEVARLRERLRWPEDAPTPEELIRRNRDER
jgi:plasmid stability protein